MAETSRRRTTSGAGGKTAGKKGGSGRGKQTGSGGSAKSPGNASGKRKAAKKGQASENSFIRAEVMIIGSFALALLLFLSNFHLCGVVGDVLRGFMLGMFGGMGFVVPIVICVGTGFYMSNRGNVKAAVKLLAAVTALLALCALDQMIFGNGYAPGWKLTEYYTLSSDGTGGGLLGGLLAAALGMSLGTVGAYVVLVVLLAMALVCITEKSLVKAVQRGGDKAYRYAREDIGRRRELHAERAEERKRLREEQRVRGVNLDSTNLMEGMGPFNAVNSAEDPADIFTGRISRPEPSEAEYAENVDAPLQADFQKQPEHEEPQPDVKKEEKEERPGACEPARIYSSADELDAGEEDLDVREIFPVHSLKQSDPFEDVDMAADEEPPSRISSDWTGDDDSDYGDGSDGVNDSDEPLPWDALAPETKAVPAEGLVGDSLCVAEGTKRVVTAGGKIIERDTELLQKKLEGRGRTAESGAVSSDALSFGPRGQQGTAFGASPRGQAKAPGQSAPGASVQPKPKPAPEPKREYIFPSTNLLKKGERKAGGFSDREYRETAIKLQQTLKNFGVGVTVTDISCGPSVTRYELHPEQGVKVSKIVSLADDIKLNLAAADIRIEAPIPGKAAVGIEVPNKENNTVYLRDLLESEEFKRHPSPIAFAVGKDIGGQTVVTDIGKMPHLLIAGATGSGKSVCINTLIMSILYKSNPDDVKLIMVDPKVVELSVYNGIPHLLIPVVTDPKKASGALNWAVAEMTDRYKKFADCNVRDLKGYNEKIKSIENIDDANKPQKLPRIIIIVDELADLMMVAPGEVEDAICRLAQLARAAGIHLVIATQRPSVNVITGLIKANVPSRIAFSVSSGVDSRTIIDMNGAEKLLGKGDMLFYPAGFPKPQRVQGAFVSDQEVSRVVEFITSQNTAADYSADIEMQMSSPQSQGDSRETKDGRDDYFVQAGRFIIEKDKASIGMLQRMFKIGFNRAARIMDQLAEAGVVGEEEGTKPRKILITMEQFDEMINSGL